MSVILKINGGGTYETKYGHAPIQYVVPVEDLRYTIAEIIQEEGHVALILISLLSTQSILAFEVLNNTTTIPDDDPRNFRDGIESITISQ